MIEPIILHNNFAKAQIFQLVAFSSLVPLGLTADLRFCPDPTYTPKSAKLSV